MILDIDAGNSSIKWRVADEANILQRGVVTHDQNTWSSLIEHKFDLGRVRISNVAGAELGVSLTQWINDNIGVAAELAVAQSEIAGVISGYSAPETLGVDRWLAVVAGWNRVKGACLVVDAGSALTVDFVAANGRHQGGYIVPGLYMMFDALYGGTASVRYEQSSGYGQLPGKNTAEAVQNGCLMMSVALIDNCLRQKEGEEGIATLVLTGGGAPALKGHFGDKVTHVPELVLDGLGLALP
jgi:type III pantothenate kinase